MNCPFCGHLEDKVVDSRESREGDAIRRRRQCLADVILRGGDVAMFQRLPRDVGMLHQ